MKKSLTYLTVITLLIGLFPFYSFSSNLPPQSDVYNGQRGISFNANWRFFKGDALNAEKCDFVDSTWRKLDVPHDWSIEQSFCSSSSAGWGAGYLDGEIGWYRKSFSNYSTELGKRITIQFEGIFMNSTVCINGHELGTRPYGYIKNKKIKSN